MRGTEAAGLATSPLASGTTRAPPNRRQQTRSQTQVPAPNPAPRSTRTARPSPRGVIPWGCRHRPQPAREVRNRRGYGRYCTMYANPRRGLTRWEVVIDQEQHGPLRPSKSVFGAGTIYLFLYNDGCTHCSHAGNGLIANRSPSLG